VKSGRGVELSPPSNEFQEAEGFVYQELKYPTDLWSLSHISVTQCKFGYSSTAMIRRIYS